LERYEYSFFDKIGELIEIIGSQIMVTGENVPYDDYYMATILMPYTLAIIFVGVYLRRNKFNVEYSLIFAFVSLLVCIPVFRLIPSIIIIILVYVYLFGYKYKKLVEIEKQKIDYYDLAWITFVENSKISLNKLRFYRYISMVLLIGLRLAFYFIVGY